jgi:hypothetical protein
MPGINLAAEQCDALRLIGESPHGLPCGLHAALTLPAESLRLYPSDARVVLKLSHVSPSDPVFLDAE